MGIETILKPVDLRKISGKAELIARGMRPEERALARQYALIALCMGKAYDGVRSVDTTDVVEANNAYIAAGELIAAVAELATTPNLRLADRVLEVARKELREYGVDGRRHTLSADELLSAEAIRSWARKYEIEATESYAANRT